MILFTAFIPIKDIMEILIYINPFNQWRPQNEILNLAAQTGW
jgi:hypothetical protein